MFLFELYNDVAVPLSNNCHCGRLVMKHNDNYLTKVPQHDHPCSNLQIRQSMSYIQ